MSVVEPLVRRGARVVSDLCLPADDDRDHGDRERSQHEASRELRLLNPRKDRGRCDPCGREQPEQAGNQHARTVLHRSGRRRQFGARPLVAQGSNSRGRARCLVARGGTGAGASRGPNQFGGDSRLDSALCQAGPLFCNPRADKALASCVEHGRARAARSLSPSESCELGEASPRKRSVSPRGTRVGSFPSLSPAVVGRRSRPWRESLRRWMSASSSWSGSTRTGWPSSVASVPDAPRRLARLL